MFLWSLNEQNWLNNVPFITENQIVFWSNSKNVVICDVLIFVKQYLC